MQELKDELNKIFNTQSFDKIKINETLDIKIDDTLNFQNFQSNNDLSKKLNKLKKFETIYCKSENKNILPKLTITIQILQDAKYAIEILNSIDKNNKKLAYYESNKNASLEDLEQIFKSKLTAIDENELISQSSIKEVEFKMIITSLKKDNPTLYHYYQLVSNLFNPNADMLEDDELDGYEILNKLENFFGIGHATQSHILKSVAIQLYELYKNDNTNFTELTNLIGEIIDIHFETDRNYQNFKNFNQQKPYLKNVVGKFIVFDINDNKNDEQQIIITDFFENILIKDMPELNNDFMKQILLSYLQNPVKFYLDMTNLKYFGF